MNSASPFGLYEDVIISLDEKLATADDRQIGNFVGVDSEKTDILKCKTRYSPLGLESEKNDTDFFNHQLWNMLCHIRIDLWRFWIAIGLIKLNVLHKIENYFFYVELGNKVKKSIKVIKF